MKNVIRFLLNYCYRAGIWVFQLSSSIFLWLVMINATKGVDGVAWLINFGFAMYVVNISVVMVRHLLNTKLEVKA